MKFAPEHARAGSIIEPSILQPSTLTTGLWLFPFTFTGQKNTLNAFINTAAFLTYCTSPYYHINAWKYAI